MAWVLHHDPRVPLFSYKMNGHYHFACDVIRQSIVWGGSWSGVGGGARCDAHARHTQEAHDAVFRDDSCGLPAARWFS